MFSGCTNLTEVDLSGWTGMESPAITGMFTNAPVNINLTADNDAIGTAIKEEYEKNTSSVRKTMENAGVKSIGKHNIQRNTNPYRAQIYSRRRYFDVWYNRANHW